MELEVMFWYKWNRLVQVESVKDETLMISFSRIYKMQRLNLDAKRRRKTVHEKGQSLWKI